MSPGLFTRMINPSWAKVHNELSFGRKELNEHLAWDAEEVKREFISLTGFDPGKAQYADADVQHACLDTARELDSALYMADELIQLDGRPALVFAMGWMSGRTWLSGADPSGMPDADTIAHQAMRHALAVGYAGNVEFITGFTRRVEQGHAFVA
ncbi:hypothetical protein ACKF11_13785 [Methylobacillus sp. Pita2]|uniref:hypothetical protein n=1 Tax=Methylobacillus sp. Pita2 TaxID=3383245 RepID=UPI0038B4D539